jgi:hypothetical protein
MADQPKEKGKGMASEEGGVIPNLEERLGMLNLQGEEEDDLDFSGEFEELVKEVRWLVLFRVHTSKPFIHAALFSALRNVWSDVKEVTFKVLAPNLFLAQLHCLGDWNRVMDGSPWLFRGAAIVMDEYDGFSNVHTYKLDKIPVWARIQGVLEGLMKKRELAEKVAQKVGDPITVVVNEGKLNPTPYLRTRVWIEIHKPLVRAVPITLKERMRYLVQYEKLPTFCFFCGCIGHGVTECGDGVHRKESCQWGDWLRVPFLSLMPGREDARGGRGGGRGRRRGRGGGRGDSVQDDTEDMETSMGDEDLDKTLSLKKGEINEGGSGGVAMEVISTEQSAHIDVSISPLKEQKKKRPRRNGGE